MKKNFIILTALCCGCLSGISQVAMIDVDSTQSAAIQKGPAFSGSLEMNYLRHYLWRGAEFGNNDVAQPELVLNWKNFSLALSANLNYNPAALPEDLYKKNVVYDEQDIEIGYSTSYKKFDFEFKGMAYFYFNQIGSPNTAELYNRTAFNLTKSISLFTENSIDIVSYKGAFYNNTGISYSKDLHHNFSIELIGYAGMGNKKFNDAYFGSGTGGFNLIGSSLELTKEIGSFYITASGEVNKYSSKAIKKATELNHTDNFGIAVGINF